MREHLAVLRLPPEREIEIVEELALHLEAAYEDALADGLSETEAEARAVQGYDWRLLECELNRAEQPPAARALQPSLELIEREGGIRMESFLQDLRFGARMLLKNPGFTLIAVITLSLGIGVNTAIFSVVNAVLLQPLPYADPGRLAFFYDSIPGFNLPKVGLTEAEFLRLRSEASSFERVSLYNAATVTVTGVGEPERLLSAIVSADFFATLGVEMGRGRAFKLEEESRGQSDVVILSYGFWQRKLAADPGAIGRSLTLDGRSCAIVGVLPQGFKSPLEFQSAEQIELWRPPGYDPTSPSLAGHDMNVIGRVRTGLSLEQAQAEAIAITARLMQDHPKMYPANRAFQTLLKPLHQEIVGDLRLALLMLTGAVSFVLLIACANVANLLLVRSEARHKEIAVRHAVGASHGRIVRQLLTESVLLAVIGGGLGVLLAALGLDALLRLGANNLPRLQEVRIDRWALGVTALISLLTGVVFGLAPALQTVRFGLRATLKEGSRSSAAPAGRTRLRAALVVTEVALSLLLLIGAGLLIKSFWRLQQINPGFKTEQLLTLRLFPSAASYPEPRQVTAFYEQALEHVQSAPGVKDAAVVSNIPIGQRNNATVMQIEGQPVEMGGANVTVFRVVTPSYFRTMGMRLLRGRWIEDSDQADATRVAVINETAAHIHWPAADPLGRRIRLLNGPPEQATTQFLTVVGVVADAKNSGMMEDARQEVYVPLRQRKAAIADMGSGSRMALVVRSATEPTSLTHAIRQAVRAIDRTVPISEVRTMEQIVGTTAVQPRFNTLLLGFFAAVALLLAVVGIYGVMSYSITQRTREIGIRMALGATRGNVLWMALRQGLGLVLIGLLLGIVGALAITRLMVRLLYNVSATDPTTFVLIAVMLAIVSLLACYFPARRATKIDPMLAIRAE